MQTLQNFFSPSIRSQDRMATQRLISDSDRIGLLVERGFLSQREAAGLSLEQFVNFDNRVIQQLVIDHVLTVKQAKQLNYDQRRAFESQGIRDLITDNILTVEQVMQFSEDQFDTFDTEAIRDLITVGRLSAEQAMKFGHDQREIFQIPALRARILNGELPATLAMQLHGDSAALSLACCSQAIDDLITQQRLTLQDALSLNMEQLKTVENPVIRQLINDHLLTVQQAIQFRPFHVCIFTDKNILPSITDRTFAAEEIIAALNKGHRDIPEAEQAFCTLIADGTLTADQIAKFDANERAAFNNATTRSLIVNHVLTVGQAVQTLHLNQNLRGEYLAMFNNPAFLALITNKALDIDQVLQFNYQHIINFSNKNILALIADQTLRVDQVIRFGYEQLRTFDSPIIRGLIANHVLRVDQAMLFDRDMRETFASAHIRTLLNNGALTADQVSLFNENQRAIFRNDSICKLMARGLLRVEDAMRFDGNHRATFERSAMRALVADGILTVAQVMEFGPDHRVALEDEQTLNRLRSRQLTYDQFMGHRRRTAPTPATPVINNSQSTHKASVHKSVSESATRLWGRYGSKITGDGLHDTIRRIQIYVESLPATSNINTAAKRCIARITSPFYTFTDPGSGISLKQLLALAFLAINDEAQRTGTLDDARELFVRALYEIQRGGNFSEEGEDIGGADSAICTGGSFNKVVEKLKGVHPDCDILYISKETAALKLPIVVREEALKHLATLSAADTLQGQSEFAGLVGRVKKEGVEVIWDQIQNHVTDRMFDEFGSLYSGKSAPTFAGFIEAGQNTELGGLDSLLQVSQPQLPDPVDTTSNKTTIEPA